MTRRRPLARVTQEVTEQSVTRVSQEEWMVCIPLPRNPPYRVSRALLPHQHSLSRRSSSAEMIVWMPVSSVTMDATIATCCPITVVAIARLLAVEMALSMMVVANSVTMADSTIRQDPSAAQHALSSRHLRRARLRRRSISRSCRDKFPRTHHRR